MTKVFSDAQEQRIRDIIATAVFRTKPEVEAIDWPISRQPPPSANLQPRYDEAVARVLPDGRLDRRNAALFLGREPKTLAEWQRLGKGPLPRKMAGRVFYYLRDLEAFRDTGARHAPTSGSTAGPTDVVYGGPVGGGM